MSRKLLVAGGFLTAAVTAAIVGTGCSTAKVRVMPGENGMNRAVAKDIKQEGAEEAAADAAKDYCSKKDKEAVFVKDASKYTGKMDENTRNTIHKASTAAMVLGGYNSPAHTAGSAGYMMTSDRDYESEVVFKCQ